MCGFGTASRHSPGPEGSKSDGTGYSTAEGDWDALMLLDSHTHVTVEK